MSMPELLVSSAHAEKKCRKICVVATTTVDIKKGLEQLCKQGLGAATACPKIFGAQEGLVRCRKNVLLSSYIDAGSQVHNTRWAFTPRKYLGSCWRSVQHRCLTSLSVAMMNENIFDPGLKIGPKTTGTRHRRCASIDKATPTYNF
ncbi:uncharacterized protein RCO7_07178 [Rhynchosporium graminicola]|uniref:Uncharacterized protein n=1 Tax=Rhynchosporium graminicola TaxID=2792576 RepID=A0A1E1LB28_9HELO|nr:uncharacterized protein RCO7_07178 [Rhynchosporium commune]